MSTVANSHIDAAWIANLYNGKKQGNEWLITCPNSSNHSNGDKNRSCTIKDGDKGFPVPHCHSGCMKSKELIALLVSRGQFPEREKQEKPRNDDDVQIQWDTADDLPFYDETGKLRYKKTRYLTIKEGKPGKFFAFYHPKSDVYGTRPGKDWGWEKGQGDNPDLLFNLPQVIEAAANEEIIIIHEGEGKARACSQLGFVGTSSGKGASKGDIGKKWHKSFNQYFKGAEVYIIPDNDQPGRNFAEYICASLHSEGIEVKWIELPGVKPKGDIIDWIKEGNGSDELMSLLTDAQPWTPKGPPVVKTANTDLPEENEQQGAVLQLIKTEKKNIITNVNSLSHVGIAHRFCQEHSHNVKSTQKGWLCYDEESGIFKPKSVYGLLEQTLTKFSEEFVDDGVAPVMKRLKATHWMTAGAYNSILNIVSEDPLIKRDVTDFDLDPYLLNFQNCVVDLRTGEKMPHSRDFFMSKSAACTWEGIDAESEMWSDFVGTAMGWQPDVIEYIARAGGVTMSGKMVARVFFSWGRGRNGKSTFLETIAGILGDYAVAPRAEMFMKRANETQMDNPHILVGARMANCDEVEKGDRLNETFVKRATGGGKLNGRLLRHEPFQFVPQCKIWFCCNDLPRITGTDTGTWSRPVLIPFNFTFPAANRIEDYHLVMRDAGQWPGIAAFFVRGAIEYFKPFEGRKIRGLDEPPLIVSATENYRDSEDHLKQCIDECFEKEFHSSAQFTASYRIYELWCQAAGVKGVGRRENWKREMEKKGYILSKDSHRDVYEFKGLQIRQEWLDKLEKPKRRYGNSTDIHDD